ncbi:MAG: GNAT family protein [Stappiaceae bacterium]
MPEDMRHWTPCKRPSKIVMEGRFVRLEPLSLSHTAELYAASAIPDAHQRFMWLSEYAPSDPDDFTEWVNTAMNSTDPVYFAVIDKQSGTVGGRQTFMRIDSANGVIETGSIYWGPLIARKAAATEALFLFAQHIFDELGYRRFEWKCNNDNEPSKRAALRFGFQYEGTFRQHMIVKGVSRDTAWFAMTDKDWPKLRQRFQNWLDPSNFDTDGQQKLRLQDCG